MEAAASGCADAGGRSVGILPGDSRLDANPYVTVAVATGIGEARNAIVVRTADVVIAVRGEFGTLSEIALALKMGKPVVGLGTWELARDGEAVDAIVRASDPGDAVSKALATREPPLARRRTVPRSGRKTDGAEDQMADALVPEMGDPGSPTASEGAAR